MIAHISGGRPGYAFRLMEDKSLLEFRVNVSMICKNLRPPRGVDKFAYAEKLAKEKDVMRQVLLIRLSYWRDVLLRAAKADSPLANVDRADEIKTLAKKLDLPAARQRVPTIVSRCEVLRLRPLPLEQVEKELERRGAESGQASLIAHVSGGRPGYAFRLLEDKSLLEFRGQRLDDLQKLLTASRVDKFAYAEKLAKEKDVMRQVFLVWQSFWRDVLLRAAQADSPLANVDRAEEIETAGEETRPACRPSTCEGDRARHPADGTQCQRAFTG